MNDTDELRQALQHNLELVRLLSDRIASCAAWMRSCIRWELASLARSAARRSRIGGLLGGYVDQRPAGGVRPVRVGDAVPGHVGAEVLDGDGAAGHALDGGAVRRIRADAARAPVANGRLADSDGGSQAADASCAVDGAVKVLHTRIITLVIDFVNTIVIHISDEIPAWKPSVID